LWEKGKSKKIPPEAINVALRKLMMVDSAYDLKDLRVPKSNHLEGLVEDRKGQFSIRINKKWRICFHFENGKAHNVEIVDYH
jgi:proteic killer suppression protein